MGKKETQSNNQLRDRKIGDLLVRFKYEHTTKKIKLNQLPTSHILLKKEGCKKN